MGTESGLWATRCAEAPNTSGGSALAVALVLRTFAVSVPAHFHSGPHIWRQAGTCDVPGLEERRWESQTKPPLSAVDHLDSRLGPIDLPFLFLATQKVHQYHDPITASYLTTTTNHCQLSLTSYNLPPVINQPSKPSNYDNNNDQGPLYYVTIM
jgi:hypothetical protein